MEALLQIPWFGARDLQTGSLYKRPLYQDTSPIQQTTFSKEIMDTTANPVSVDNTLVWILAFAPLIGGIIDVMLGIWISTLVINIALSYMDDNNLKKQGVDTEKFGSAWLVPVYLYNRAQYFNHGMSYFSIWIITFVFSFFLIG